MLREWSILSTGGLAVNIIAIKKTLSALFFSECYHHHLQGLHFILWLSPDNFRIFSVAEMGKNIAGAVVIQPNSSDDSLPENPFEHRVVGQLPSKEPLQEDRRLSHRTLWIDGGLPAREPLRLLGRHLSRQPLWVEWRHPSREPAPLIRRTAPLQRTPCRTAPLQ